MALYTSYLGFLYRKDTEYVPWYSPDGLRYVRPKTETVQRNEEVGIVTIDVVYEPVFVMRCRGNNPVEPPEMVLRLAKEGAITWEGYRDAYLDSLNNEESLLWMQQVAKKAFDHDVVLICFERSAEHCHRRLLAEYIQEHYTVPYKGEL